MGQLISLLAIVDSIGGFPWAEIGALLLGLGSMLCGWAAVIVSKRASYPGG
jgi:hypothetical protein